MKIAKRSEILADIEKLARAYKIVFDSQSPMVQLVLADLVKFCRARELCFHPDARVHALLEGRRDVWLRIEQHTLYDPEEILERTTRQVNSFNPQPSPQNAKESQ